MYFIIIAAIVVGGIVWFVRHHRSMCRRAQLMQEDLAHKDFTFRLPKNGLLPVEPAIQEALNVLG
ncbi:MAG: sensor histidine kinase, partial [Prevotella sp.]|nr:sensor histidine kinase [Prevotella sp.]